METTLAPNHANAQNVSLNGTALHNENLQSGQTPIIPPQEPTTVINGRAGVDLNMVTDDYKMALQAGQGDVKSPKEKIARTSNFKFFKISF